MWKEEHSRRYGAGLVILMTVKTAQIAKQVRAREAKKHKILETMNKPRFKISH